MTPSATALCAFHNRFEKADVRRAYIQGLALADAQAAISVVLSAPQGEEASTASVGIGKLSQLLRSLCYDTMGAAQEVEVE